MKIGIPRGLYFYDYYPFWETFFQELGVDVVTSKPTDKETLNLGVEAAVDDACLPVKVFFGHARFLKDRVDYLFIPRYVSEYRRTYICPKFLGLPEMIIFRLKAQNVLSHDLTAYRKGEDFYRGVYVLGKKITPNGMKIMRAIYAAWKNQKAYLQKKYLGYQPLDLIDGKQNYVPDLKKPLFAVVGHAYNINDRHASMDLIKKIRRFGGEVLTPDNVPFAEAVKKAGILPKKPFWSFAIKNFGGSIYLAENYPLKGIISLNSFGCGPDSIITELTGRYLRRKFSLPFLNLTIDEHTGEAGLVTRLEAFWDMTVERSFAGESYLPAHG
ncbi:acyl-CoA dehydratase activase-related protein [Carboxydothermus hydrogenoformans]|uniref:DUF2229 domain-containing protein n=1 Tax=Carboxydothermus hydrogenoformans (strain ATCC BAA-161 / DSM 6008 / Z-2901) TaxID=246194 RepID=Q3AAR1_CARHZ|nr:acyl-CoA dehydratase activase-related protein [Carboxydothermus hydrogenoformans]ABB15079.1 conserved hypothetical protein [Carboxydothermus hydrogenoformans Z-2901]